MERAQKILETLVQISSQAEVNWLVRRRNTLLAGSGSPVAGSGTVTSYSVRIQRNGRAGTAGSEGGSHAALIAENAISSARTGPDFTWDLPSDSPSTAHFVNRGKLPDSAEVLSFVGELASCADSAFPGTLLSARVSWGKDGVGIINSQGCFGEYLRNRVRVDATVSSATEDGLYRRSSHFECTCLPDPSTALQWLFPALSCAGARPETVVGRKPVIFAPPALGVLLQAVRTGVSGRVLLDGASWLAGKTGDCVLSPLLTIREMPLHENGASSAPFDSEGISTSNKALFRNGVFKGFVFDLASGCEAGLPSTGNAGKNLGGHPMPVCTNITVDTGNGGSLEEMAGRIGNGILVSGILSAEGSDAAGGGMLLDCGTAWSISGGEVTGRLVNCLISGSAYEILQSVCEVGSVQHRAGTDLLPCVTAEGVRIR
ncbi:MAG: metallopeptidase TldD-related protein [Candidatus Fermentibacteraceae bacterium]